MTNIDTSERAVVFTGRMRVLNIKLSSMGMLGSWRHEIQQEWEDLGTGKKRWVEVPIVTEDRSGGGEL